MDYLLFRLYGPLASWGGIAVGQERPSDAYPSLSALLGLLAAAMGVQRDEEDLHQRMAAAYGCAIRVDAPGVLLRDYHTAQVPPERRKVVHYTRRDELNADSLNTILSSREYRCDAFYTVALWVRADQPAPFTLAALTESLEKPRYTLYLGRKSCPLALPVQPQRVSAASLQAAFAQTRFADDADFLEKQNERETDFLKRSAQVLLCWDAEAADVDTGGWQPLQTITRRDRPLSRRRWQFSERREHQGRVER